MAVVFLVVLHVDPKHLFHQEVLPASPPLHGEAMPGAIFFKYGPRPLKLAHLKYIEPPDLVLLGSSRTMLINSSMFSSSIKFFNFSVDTAKYRDYIGFWEALAEANKRPPYLMVVPDGYTMNRKASAGVWFNTLKYFDRFADKNVRPPQTVLSRIRQLQEKMTRRMMEVWYVANESMNWEMFRDSIKSMWHNEPVWDMKGVAKVKDISGDTLLYLGDGAINDFPMPKDEALTKARRYGSLGQGLSETQMYPWGINKDAIQWFDIFLKDARQKGTRVMIIIPPDHPLSFKNISTLRLLSQPLEQYQLAFKELAEANPGTAFCNVMNPSLLGCTEDDFVDALHMESSCGKRLMQYCLFKQAGWDDLRRR